MTEAVATPPQGRARMPAAITDHDRALAREWAEVFRERGFNPLPIDENLRHPVYGYRQFWETPIPDHVYDNHPSACLQVMTGRFWGLLVVDLDGEGAKTRFAEIAKGRGPLPRTWSVRSGGGGKHLWFSIPRDHPRRLPGGPLWVGEGKHNRIDRICDHGLIVAPPSIHHRTGNRYLWEKGCSPLDIRLPARCPAWLLNMPTTHERARMERRASMPPLPQGPDRFAHVHKIALCKSWGIRFTGKRSAAGWHECHSPFREDTNPSAAIHEESGFFNDFGDAVHGKLSLVDLAVALGVYPTPQEAVKGIANGK